MSTASLINVQVPPLLAPLYPPTRQSWSFAGVEVMFYRVVRAASLLSLTSC